MVLELGDFESEVDITIVDRIQSLLTPQPLSQSANPSAGSYRPYQSMAQVLLASSSPFILSSAWAAVPVMTLIPSVAYVDVFI